LVIRSFEDRLPTCSPYWCFIRVSALKRAKIAGLPSDFLRTLANSFPITFDVAMIWHNSRKTGHVSRGNQFGGMRATMAIHSSRSSGSRSSGGGGRSPGRAAAWSAWTTDSEAAEGLPRWRMG